MQKLNVDPKEIDTILVTHHHSDHSKSALRASKKWGCNLISNAETARRLEWEGTARLKIFSELERIDAGVDISLLTVPVPHDDAENVAVIACDSNGKRAAVVTDLGEVTAELISHLKNCNHISIEANYDHDRLMKEDILTSEKEGFQQRRASLKLSNCQSTPRDRPSRTA